jgi:hypothetical protein
MTTIKTIAVSTSSVTTLLNSLAFFRTLTATSSTTNTISKAQSFYRTIAASTVTSVATIIREVSKIVIVASSVQATISTSTQRFVLLVTTVYTSVVSYIHQVLPNVVDTVFVPTRKVLVKAVGFVSILVRPKKTNVVASKQDDIYG